MTDGMREAYGAPKVALKEEKKIDPGNEFSGPSRKRLEEVINWLRKHPDMNLKTGEGKLLLDEIDRLKEQLDKVSKQFHESQNW